MASCPKYPSIPVRKSSGVDLLESIVIATADTRRRAHDLSEPISEGLLQFMRQDADGFSSSAGQGEQGVVEDRINCAL